MLPDKKIEVFVEEEFRPLVNERWVKRVAQQVLEAEGVASPYEVSLVFAGSQTVQRLNRDYRGVDETTDVLAFDLLHEKGANSSFALPPDGVTRLGEVVISYPQAMEQAKEQRHSSERELALLVIHGTLHLLGYEDEDPEEESKMRERERELFEEMVSQGLV